MPPKEKLQIPLGFRTKVRQGQQANANVLNNMRRAEANTRRRFRNFGIGNNRTARERRANNNALREQREREQLRQEREREEAARRRRAAREREEANRVRRAANEAQRAANEAQRAANEAQRVANEAQRARDQARAERQRRNRSFTENVRNIKNKVEKSYKNNKNKYITWKREHNFTRAMANDFARLGYNVTNLNNPPTKQAARSAYLRAVIKSHPNKGGNVNTHMSVENAYRRLISFYK